MAAPSQKNRPISVSLDGAECVLNIRPEDLSWSEPSRIAVNNTLGSAWVDAFGPGIATITISGHTGWSGRRGADDFGPDWESQFALLHQVAFKGWHDKVEATKDPESVEMLFADSLDSRVVRVVPGTFVLRRNKNRPLLMQYTITFQVIEDRGAGSGGGGGEGQSLLGALNDFARVAALAVGYAQSGVNAANGSVGNAMALLSQVIGPTASGAIQAVMSIANSGNAIVQTLANGGSSAAPAPSPVPRAVTAPLAAINAAGAAAITHLSAAASALPAPAMATVMEMGNTLRTTSAMLSTAFTPPAGYPSYDPLYGSSMGSGAQGSPIATWRPGNPLSEINPVETPVVAMTSEAMAAATALITADPVIDPPLTPTEVGQYLLAIAQGTTLEAA